MTLIELTSINMWPSDVSTKSLLLGISAKLLLDSARSSLSGFLLNATTRIMTQMGQPKWDDIKILIIIMGHET